MTIQNNFRRLNNTQSALFLVGGLLMAVSLGCFVFMFQQQIASFVFLLGAVLFAVMQCMQTYHGTDLTVKRLKSIMTMADLLFVLSGVLMIDTTTRFLRPVFTNQEYYIQYVYNKWIVLLLIAVVLEVYSTHRISYEIRKQQESEDTKE